MVKFLSLLKNSDIHIPAPVVLAVGICLYNWAFKITFIEMFIVLLLLLFYVSLLFGKCNTTKKKNRDIIASEKKAIKIANRGVARPFEYARKCSFAILIFGLTATCALNNYINPSEEIFVNSDHHVLRAEGIEIPEAASSYFKLAGSDKNSFLDVKEFHGRVNVIDVNDEGVQLRLENFTQPLYLHSIGDDNRTIRQSILNRKSLLLFNVGDTISFHTQNSDVRFYIDEVAIGKSSAKRDSVFYFAEYKNEVLCSEHTRLLRTGLPMRSLMSSVYVDAIDFNGIDLIRPLVLPLTKSDNLITRYNGEYAISLSESFFEQDDEGSKIIAISINDNRYDLSQLNDNRETITIPYDTYFSMGYGEHKSSIVKFEKGDGDLLKLLYQFPQRRYLSTTEGEQSNTIYFTSSLMQKLNDDYQHPDHNILFDLFYNTDNVNNITPAYLSFCNGRSIESIQFSLHYTDGKTSINNLESEEQINGIKGINSDVIWLLSIENLRKTTPFNSTRLILLLWATIIMSIICILFKSTHNICHKTKKLYCSYPEYAVYMLLIAFLTIRLFLMWRVSVFPPVSQISIYEFGMLRNIEMYNWLVYFISPFYFIIFIFKVCLYKFRGANIPKSIDWSLSKQCVVFGSVSVILYGVAVLAKLISLGWIERFVNILAPILVYLFIEFLIYRFYNRSYNKTEDSTTDYNKRALVFSLGNFAIAASLLLLNDGGFGIMFVAFGLILLPLKLIDINISNDNNQPLRLKITLIIQVVVVIIGYVFYNKIILGLMNISNENILQVAMVVFPLVLLFVGLVLYVISNNNNFFKKGTIVIALVATLVICSALYVFNRITDGSHTEYRARVLLSPTPDDILSNLKADSNDENEFLRASLNDWVLGEYLEEGANVDSYFELSPHSRIGAMWGAQTTDIALARFIVAEHSRFLLPILFIFAFLALTLIVLHFCTYHRWSRLVIIQIPLLLTMQALYIWMANTRMFIFIGQDFPFLSLTSKFSIAYFLVLLLIIVLITLYERSNTQLFFNDNEFYHVYNKNNTVLNNFIVVNGCIFIIAALFYHNYRENDSENNGYKINKLLSETSESINVINQDFLKYQQDTTIALKENMTPVVRDFVNYTNIDSLFLQAENTSVFARSLFDLYVKKLAKTNSPNQLLHMRKNSEGKLVFSVKHEFYNLYLPEKYNNSWNGGIVESNNKSTAKIQHTEFSDFDIYNLPDSWFPNNNKISIVRAKSDNIKIMSLGNNHPINIKKGGMTSTMFVREFDQVLVDDKHVESLPISDRAYFARNLIVNGQRRFVYPLQSDLFWAKNFAEHIRAQKSTTLDSEGNDKDVQINLDIKLTKSLIEKLGGLGYGSVIVADGAGAIKALVDSRMVHELDPNDISQINSTIEELYMEGLQGSSAERLYFGNLNLLPLFNGPGSSQKPIVWNAVMSGYDLGWDELMLAKINDKHMDKSGKDYLGRYYNNVAFLSAHPFRSPMNDEGAGSSDVDLNTYISRSSNYYHSLIVYIGSFPVQYFEAKDEFNTITTDEDNTTSLFRSVKSPDKLTRDEYNSSFPIMKLGRNYISFNRALSEDDIPSSMLHKKLKTNYGLYGSMPDSYTNLYPSIGYKNLANYVYAEPSVLHVDMRSQNHNSMTYFYEDAIRFTTIGGKKVWDVTPLKMAEMYGRLISQNSTYTLSLDPSVEMKYTPMSIDKSWNKSDYFKNLKAMFKGMEAVFVENGTAANTGIKKGDYYVYGKTGTINNRDKKSNTNIEDHILATVICNMDIATIKSVDDLKKIKFYVIYTALYNSQVFKNTSKIHKDIYDAVVSSDCFNNYMKINYGK